MTFQCQAEGDVDVTIETIPDFDTVVGCPGAAAYDPEIVPNIVTITQTFGCGMYSSRRLC